jgi:Arc/MetJ family transcription regulator
MLRKNLVLDERLLQEAVRLSGERTYSGVVQRALHDYVRRIRARRILSLGGTGLPSRIDLSAPAPCATG